jgi:hypothetical protein
MEKRMEKKNKNYEWGGTRPGAGRPFLDKKQGYAKRITITLPTSMLQQIAELDPSGQSKVSRGVRYLFEVWESIVQRERENQLT